MQFRATHMFADISASKARSVIDLIRGKHVNDALGILRATSKRASYVIDKVLRSAMANADQSLEADMENLWVKEAYVDPGPTRRKWWPRARGRAAEIRSRTSHIRILLDDTR
jgi:large subunit ribosomal protein L22